jgi:U4/U6.U5 tri-snRNP-associated protein 1
MKEGGEEEIELSIDETNKLREKLGLKPLKVEENKSKEKKFVHKPAEKKEELSEVQNRIERVKWERKKRMLKMKKSLTEENTSSDEDAFSFIKKIKKEKKKVKTIIQNDYETKELEGLTISHDLNKFSEGGVILTLKDVDVLDEKGEDELENVDMIREEKKEFEKRQEKKRKGYDVYQSLENQNEKLLSQYDEEDFYKSKKKTVIGKLEINIEEERIDLNDDKKYEKEGMYKDEEIKFQKDYLAPKIKKRKKKNIMEKPTFYEKEEIQEEIPIPEQKKIKLNNNEKYEMALEKANENSKYLMFDRKFDILKEINETNQEEEKLKEEKKKNEYFVLNQTEEFLNNLNKQEGEEEEIKIKKRNLKREKNQNDIKMEENYSIKMEDNTSIKTEENEENMMKEESINKKIKQENESNIIEEPLIETSLLSTLLYASQYDLIDKEEKIDENKKINYSKELKNSKTNFSFNLEKRDKSGRILSEKEAFKELSHVFHGKFPSKNKIEKNKRKQNIQLKKNKMNIGDTPLNSVEAFDKITSFQKSPFIVVDGFHHLNKNNDDKK